MDIQNIVPPQKVPIIEGAAVGAVILMLMSGKLDWKLAVLISVTSITSATFFTEPVAALLHLDSGWYGGMGCLIGFSAMYIFGALLGVLRNFETNPFGVIWKFIDAFRGRDPK